ncbi:MAG: PQQ-binding-like beta-propeller repeat protein [bacterium]
MQRHETKCSGPHELMAVLAIILLGMMLCACGNRGNELDSAGDSRSTASPHPWPMELGNSQNNSLSRAKGSRSGQLLWERSLENQRGGSAIDSAGNIYIQTSSGLLSLDPDGQQRWAYERGISLTRDLLLSPEGYSLVRVSGDSAEGSTVFALLDGNGMELARQELRDLLCVISADSFLVLTDRDTVAVLHADGSLDNAASPGERLSNFPNDNLQFSASGSAVLHSPGGLVHYTTDGGRSWTSSTEVGGDFGISPAGEICTTVRMEDEEQLLRLEHGSWVRLVGNAGGYTCAPGFGPDGQILLAEDGGRAVVLDHSGQPLASLETGLRISQLWLQGGILYAYGREMQHHLRIMQQYRLSDAALLWSDDSDDALLLSTAEDGSTALVSSRYSSRVFAADGSEAWQLVHDSPGSLFIDRDDNILLNSGYTVELISPAGKHLRSDTLPAMQNGARNQRLLLPGGSLAMIPLQNQALELLDSGSLELLSVTQWEETRFRGEPLLLGQRFALLDGNNELHLIDGQGTDTASFPVHPSYPGSPSLSGSGTLIFSGSSGTRSLNLDGEQLWLNQEISSRNSTVTVSGTGELLVLTADGTLAVLDEAGSLLWRTTVAGYLYGTAAGADGNIYLWHADDPPAGGTPGSPGFLNGNTGGLTGGGVNNPPADSQEQRAPARTAGQTPDGGFSLIAWNRRGLRLWEHALANGSFQQVPPLVDSTGRLYFADGGEVLCLDGFSGSIVWRSAFGNAQSPESAIRMAMNSRGELLVLTRQGLYAFGD